MQTNTTVTDRSHELDERSWWDLWNSSYRSADRKDEVSTELFTRTSAIINELAKSGNGRLLEIACGTGTLSRMLVFSSYHGLDISPAAIEIACQKAEGQSVTPDSSKPTYEAADFHDWPLPPNQYDVVVCVDAISCFRDQRLVLQKIAQCMPVDGRLVLTTINPFVYYRIKRKWENGPVSHWFSRRELHEVIESAGLKIERSETIMPRGQLGILRIINAGRVSRAFGPRSAAFVRRWKEKLGFGQYRLVVARKMK